MLAVLGVEPGALTPLALIDDDAGLVMAVLDASLMHTDQVNFHPLINTESTGLRPADLLAFIEYCGRQPLVVDLDERPEPSGCRESADLAAPRRAGPGPSRRSGRFGGRPGCRTASPPP